MKTHELKILPQYFRVVQDGAKTFELRKNDRDYKIGDTLLLKEWENIKGKYVEEGYTGNKIKKEITYILEGGQYGLEKGYCILGLKDIDKVSIEEYKEMLTPFMIDLESELKGFERVFNFDFAIKNLIKRYENQKESLRHWREKYPNEF